jgi:hypothetical protein
MLTTTLGLEEGFDAMEFGVVDVDVDVDCMETWMEKRWAKRRDISSSYNPASKVFSTLINVIV